jgi:peroxiredoxin
MRPSKLFGRTLKKLVYPLLALTAAAIGLVLYNATFNKMITPQVTFVSIKGERIAMADLRGRVTLVNFWATDCAVCIKEMPQLVATHKKYQSRGFETIAVAMRHDPPNYVLAYVENNVLPFKVALDPMGEIAKAFGDVKLTPTTFIIGKRGEIVKKIQGEPDFKKLHELLEIKLAEPS